MKAIILCAGQGRRLLPLTATRPKCLLPVHGQRTVLETQLQTLAECGVTEARVLIGFGAEQVEQELAARPVPGIAVETVYNPFYETTDNLVTCWMARDEMDGDFLILNGDTLFEAPVLARLLAAPAAPLTLTINCKSAYDADDMKVSLASDGRLSAVGKTLDASIVHGESIGLMRFQGSGIERFRAALDREIRKPSALKAWYLSVVNDMASKLDVKTVAITGLWWGEIDSRQDLDKVRAALAARQQSRGPRAPAPLRAGGFAG